MKITKINTKNVLKFDNIEIDELTVADEEQAVRIANAESGYDFMLALLAIACTFDGKKYVMEDLRDLSRNDFLPLIKELTGKSQKDLESTPSNLQGTEELISKA